MPPLNWRRLLCSRSRRLLENRTDEEAMFRATGKLCPKTITIIILTVLLSVTATGYAVQASEPRPEMVVNEADNTISFVIDGRPIVIVGADGLHVNGHVSYSGSIMDVVYPDWEKEARDAKE